MSGPHRLASVELDAATLPAATAEIEHERRVAIFDLVEKNSFEPLGAEGGPYRLKLSLQDNRLVFDIDGEDDHVMADRIQIQQAVSNLVRNAVDAVNGRAEPLVLIVGRRMEPESYEFRVEDNGPGISQDRIGQIFRPMATSKTGGMGLGLSVTRSIVESHGATLKIDRSTLGGAVFAFRLPRVTEAEIAC